MTTSIWIYEAGLNERHSLYTAVDAEGILVERVRDPEPDAARVLKAKGVTGVMIVRDARTDAHRSTVVIEKAALLVTEENNKRSLIARKWKPRTWGIA